MRFDNKRGQVTPFIIVGIIIVVVAVLLIFVYRPDVIRPRITTTAQIDPVRDYVEECIRNVGGDALNLIAEHGGVTRVNDDHFAHYTDYGHIGGDKGLFGEKDEVYDVIFWNGKGSIMDQSSVEKEINDYIDEKIENCLNGLRYPNVKIEGNRKLKTTIGYYNTIITLDLPVSFEKGNVKIERFSYTFNRALGEFLNIVWDSTEARITDPSVDICDTIERGHTKYWCNRALDENEEIYILELKDANKNLADINYKFQFALI